MSSNSPLALRREHFRTLTCLRICSCSESFYHWGRLLHEKARRSDKVRQIRNSISNPYMRYDSNYQSGLSFFCHTIRAIRLSFVMLSEWFIYVLFTLFSAVSISVTNSLYVLRLMYSNLLVVSLLFLSPLAGGALSGSQGPLPELHQHPSPVRSKALPRYGSEYICLSTHPSICLSICLSLYPSI